MSAVNIGILKLSQLWGFYFKLPVRQAKQSPAHVDMGGAMVRVGDA